MSNICLRNMTKELCRAYHQQFAFDPDLFMDMSRFTEYRYTQEHADAHWQRQRDLNRVHLAILRRDKIIGEIVIKNIDREKKCCTFGIHLTNDTVKNKGYGTKAEILMLQYAFHEMGMNTVYADAILKNTRSQHVLTKVGFLETHADDKFRYYRCEKATWASPTI